MRSHVDIIEREADREVVVSHMVDLLDGSPTGVQILMLVRVIVRLGLADVFRGLCNRRA